MWQRRRTCPPGPLPSRAHGVAQWDEGASQSFAQHLRRGGGAVGGVRTPPSDPPPS